MEIRRIKPLTWYDWPTYCNPTRMAIHSRSRPSGEITVLRCQRLMRMAETTDLVALSKNTQELPALAITAPAGRHAARSLAR